MKCNSYVLYCEKLSTALIISSSVIVFSMSFADSDGSGSGLSYGTVWPTTSLVYKGSAFASIKCFSVTKVTWLSPKKEKIPKKRVRDNVLHFFEPKNRDTGVYTCQGTTETSNFEANAEFLVGGKFLKQISKQDQTY